MLFEVSFDSLLMVPFVIVANTQQVKHNDLIGVNVCLRNY